MTRKDCNKCKFFETTDSYSEGEEVGHCFRFPPTVAPKGLVDFDRMKANGHSYEPTLYSFPIVWSEGYGCGEFK